MVLGHGERVDIRIWQRMYLCRISAEGHIDNRLGGGPELASILSHRNYNVRKDGFTHIRKLQTIVYEPRDGMTPVRPRS
jgi:hypothetical protein